MKPLCTSLLLTAALLLPTGCGKKEITPLQRKQAATLASEAQFAMTLRDYSRAESVMAEATKLCPDDGDYWVALGSARVRLGQRDGAREAYRNGLEAFENAAAKDKKQPALALQQVYVLALLGRADDARDLQARLLKKYPDDRNIRAFIDEKRLERMLEDPQFKQFAL